MFPQGREGISEQAEASFLEPILSDVACLHFTIFISKTYTDFVNQTTSPNPNALMHSVKALSILQHRLGEEDSGTSTSDSTILTIVGFTTAAIYMGDQKTAKNHLHGLHTMVMIRGGISAFDENRLRAKILRQVKSHITRTMTDI